MSAFDYGPSLSDQGYGPGDAHVGTCARCGRMVCQDEFGPGRPDPLTWDAAGVSRCTDAAACTAAIAADVGEDIAPLVLFFRDEADDWGREGDWQQWTPAETALHYLRAYRASRATKAAEAPPAATAPRTVVTAAAVWSAATAFKARAGYTPSFVGLRAALVADREAPT